MGRRRRGCADFLQFTMNRRLVQRGQGQTDEHVDPSRDLPEYFFKYAPLLFIAALSGGRIFETPMRRSRLAGPNGAYFACCAIAHGNDEIHLRGTRYRELIPTFAAQIFERITQHLDFLNRKGVNRRTGVTAGAISMKTPLSQTVQ